MEKIIEELREHDECKEVDIDQIIVNPHQPRRHFNQEELEELAASIKSVGLIHPPLVRPLENSSQYELVAGERRFRASKLAQLKTIPVIVRHTPTMQSAEAALIENIQRVDLNPLEIAHALKKLMDQFSINQDMLSQRIGKKRSTVANYIRLLSLPKHIQNALTKNLITMGHAKAILALDSEEKQNLLFEIILRDDMNVREAEQSATKINEKAKKQQLSYVTRDFYLEQLAEKLQQHLGTKTSIQGKGKRGRIQIDYYSLDDLDRLLQLLGIKNE